MASYLSEILAAHRAHSAADSRDIDRLIDQAFAAPAGRSFAAALDVPGEGLLVIAEIKRRSPSKGALDLDLDPAEVAVTYEKGGASCLSVLTDEEFFGGSAPDLAAAKDAVGLPVLRKDFTVSPADVCDAKLMGADAVLLIVAALSDEELKSFSELAAAVGLDALTEVHDEEELERALEAGATIVGVNQRDLGTFAVDPQRAESLSRRIPGDVIAVAESGIRDADDAARLAGCGYQAILVGEALIGSSDRTVMVRSLAGHSVSARSKVAEVSEAKASGSR